MIWNLDMLKESKDGPIVVSLKYELKNLVKKNISKTVLISKYHNLIMQKP